MFTDMMIILIICLVIILPLAWLFSEFKTQNKWLRCTLGILAILSSFGVAFLVGQLNRLNYNIWYSSATRKLIDASIKKLEEGKIDIVIQELKVLSGKVQPTYERKGHYDKLAEETANKINGEIAN